MDRRRAVEECTMTSADARLIVNLRETLTRLSLRQLYFVALSLRHELFSRNLDARPEADALVAALLADARLAHDNLFGSDDP
jgi:hypothetical protein